MLRRLETSWHRSSLSRILEPMSPTIPPRGPALRGPWLATFDLDCGELVPGHRFIGRGLRDTGLMPAYDDGPDRPSFSFEYELVPGVREGEFRSAFGYIVGIGYDADVELPWDPNDSGVIAPAEGGTSTHGSRGDWPLPAEAKVLTFTLVAVNTDGWQVENPAGELVVDLAEGTATWNAVG